MSSLSSRCDNDRVPWPKGTNTSYLILPVPNVTETTRKGALAFICGNSYYKLKDDCKRHKPSVEGITPQEQMLSKKIQLESLFLDATGSGVDDDKLIDYCRFQSNPSRQSSLMKSEYIQNIVVSTQNVVNAQCNGYVLTKLSVLFSLPGGQPQGIHIDEVRSPQDVQDQGEMISVIFALQNGTKVDIEVSKPMGRQTYYVPSSSIIMFSGTLRHGGSAYSEENIRLHMYFLPSAAAKDNKRDNSITVGLTCPVPSCLFNVGNRCHAFTKTSLYNHWRIHHKGEVAVSVGKYISQMEGIEVIQCPFCGKGFTTGEEGLRKHLRKRCKKK